MIMRRDSVRPDLSKSQAELEDEFRQVRDFARENLIANIAINRGIRLLHLDDHSVVASIVVALCEAALLYAFVVSINRIFNPTAPIFITLQVLGSLATFVALATIKILYDTIVPPHADIFIPLSSSKEDLIVFRDWFLDIFSVPNQFEYAARLSGIGLLIFWIFANNLNVGFEAGSYVLAVVGSFSFSHGVYCGLRMLSITKLAAGRILRLSPLNPSESPEIEVMSWTYTKMALASSFYFSVLLMGMYWVKPWESRIVATISLIILVVGLAALLYSFLYPQYYLSVMIKSAKNKEMSYIQSMIAPLNENLALLTGREMNRLSDLSNIYYRLSASRETAVNISALGTFITSLAGPTASYAIGRLDLGAILHFAVGFFTS